MNDKNETVYEKREVIVYPMSAYEEMLWREKLGKIRTPFKRLCAELVIRFFILIGPIFSGQVMRDFAAARDMQITAGMRTRDFFATLTAPKRYRQMHYRAMLITSKQTLRLYSVALGRVLKNVIAEVSH